MKPIITERLILKQPTISDAKDMYAYATDPLVAHNAGWQTHSSLLETKDILTILIRSNEVYGIYFNNKLIGTIGLHKEKDKYFLGYALSRAFWNKGIMSEAARAVVDAYFKIEDRKILYASTFTENKRSQHVLLKLGFEFLKEDKKTLFHELRDTYIYKLDKEKFKKE